MITTDNDYLNAFVTITSFGLLPSLTIYPLISEMAAYSVWIPLTFLLFWVPFVSHINKETKKVDLRETLGECKEGWGSGKLINLISFESNMNVARNGEEELTEWKKMISLLNDSKGFGTRIDTSIIAGALERTLTSTNPNNR